MVVNQLFLLSISERPVSLQVSFLMFHNCSQSLMNLYISIGCIQCCTYKFTQTISKLVTIREEVAVEQTFSNAAMIKCLQGVFGDSEPPH